jgi:putative flippase GtrA
MTVQEVTEVVCTSSLASSGEPEGRGIEETIFFLLGWKITRFFCIGIVSSLVDIGLLYGFTTFLGIWYLVSATCSFCCGTVVSYGLNRHFTFHDTNRYYFAQLSTFAVVSLSCLVVNVALIWLFVEIFLLNYLTAKIIATVIVFFWSYYGQSRITFCGIQDRNY